MDVRATVAETLGYHLDPLMRTTEENEQIDRIVMEAMGLLKWPRPIPVSERLPEEGAEVLAYCKWLNRWMVAWLRAGGNWDSGESDWVSTDVVTHWLPLPPAPE